MPFPKQSQEREIKESPLQKAKGKLKKAKKAIRCADVIFNILTSEQYISIVNQDKKLAEMVIDYGVYSKVFKGRK